MFGSVPNVWRQRQLHKSLHSNVVDKVQPVVLVRTQNVVFHVAQVADAHVTEYVQACLCVCDVTMRLSFVFGEPFEAVTFKDC